MKIVVRPIIFVLIAFSNLVAALAAETHHLHSFERIQVTDQFYSEGASFADFNRDGINDIVSGPYWYAGPDYVKRHEVYPAKAYPIQGYSDNFFARAYDVNQDAWPDILVIGFPGKEAFWYENPQGQDEPWKRHRVHAVVDNESATVADLTGDGVPDLVFHTGGRLAYATPDRADPTKPWQFHAISPRGDYQRFTHGLGVGDVNGDQWPDVIVGNKKGTFVLRHHTRKVDRATWERSQPKPKPKPKKPSKT